MKKSLFLIIILFYWLSIGYALELQDKDDEQYQSYEEFFDRSQPYLKNVKAYEPIYFLLGEKPEKTKLQFSLRYQLFSKDASLVQDYSWLQGLNFGFTQTSFWDLNSTSKPFQDTSYKPELFFLSSNLKNGSGKLKGIFLQTGLQHESNGQASFDSRSTNIYYIKPIFMFHNPENSRGVQISPKLWVYVDNDEDNNPDLEDYRGYFDLETKIGREDRLMVESHFRPAKQGNSLQLDLSYPIQKYFANNVGVYIHLQYINSLAENMLNYKDRTEAIRLGVSLVR